MRGTNNKTCENIFKEPNEVKLNKKLPQREEIKQRLLWLVTKPRVLYIDAYFWNGMTQYYKSGYI